MGVTRDKILELLKKQSGDWLSGEDLSRLLSISRNAVSKQVKLLKESGYAIESISRRGYRLLETTDRLLPEELVPLLKTTNFGQQKIEYYDTIESTNTRAKELADAGAPEGTMVIAEYQHLGRGRRNRNWHSVAEKGIYASLILRPQIPPIEASRLTLMTAVALTEAIFRVSGLQPVIKWPNDLLASEKKIAGVLTEISTDMETVNHVVIGFGINVNLKREDFPAGLETIATSIYLETGLTTKRTHLLATCLESLEGHYQQIQQGDFSKILQLWNRYSALVGKRVQVQVLERIYDGVVAGIDLDGALLLEEENGIKRRILAGDVSPSDKIRSKKST